MADKQFNLDFYARVETDLSSIKGAVSELKRQLSGLEIPKSASKGFERSLESLNAELQNFEAMATRGVTSLSDTKKMDASWRKISTIFSSLGIQIKELGDIDFFPKEVISNIEKANKALTSYQNKVEEIRKSQAYKDKVSARGQAEADRQSATADWQREKKKLERMERASIADKAAWDQNRSKEYAEQTQKLAELNSQIEQQNKALAEQRAIQQQLHSMKVITKDGQIRESHSAALNKAKAKQEELKVAKAAAEEQKELAKKQEEAAKKVLSSAKGQETKARKKSGDDKDPKVIAAIEARTRAEQAYADAKAKSAEAAQNLEKIEKDSVATKTKVDELEGQQEAAKATATQIEGIEAQKRALESSRDAVKKAAKENETFKASLDASDTALQDQRTRVETCKTAMDAAEQAVENFNNELQLIEFTGTASEWTQLTEIVRSFTGIDLSGFQGDITRITEVLNDYKNGQIKDAPELIKKLREAVDTAAPAMQNLKEELAGTNRGLEDLKRAEGEMENLKNQILDFFSVSNAIQIFKNAVRDAFDTVKELDAAMTETAVVTDFSIGDMWEKLPEYSAQATQLGTSIKSLYEATTLYYQQGLNSEQAMGVGIETMKMARIANMDAAAATEAMTAALRGFNMEINELSATRISDVYSELAAITASDTEQIATAMSKTASIAASANMEFETTAALLAQIIETTQEAPETAGTAMKTIIARFSEVKKLKEKGLFSGEDSEGELIDVNKIQAALRTVGISMDEFFAGTQGLDSILLELASKWNTLDFETQHYIATMAAGSRQQSRFMAMMSNYERTMELVAAANDSAGASQKQFDKTLESLDAKLQKLQNAWDTFVMGLANNELIKAGVDLLTKLLETANNLTDDLGGTIGSIAKLGIALAALKTGKNVFNSIFDIAPLEQNVDKVKGITTNIAKSLKRMGVEVDTNLTRSMEDARSKITVTSNAMIGLGVAAGALGQYLRAIGMEDLAKVAEIAASGLIVFGNGLNMANSLAIAMGTNLKGLGVGLIKALGPVLLYIMAIGAALYVVYTVLKKIYDNSPNGQLKKIQKSTESAAQEANNAAEAYNNLKNAIDDIESKTSTLDELTRGTQEWREAVVALNGEVLKLVDTYPELAGFIENEGGVLRIDYEKTQMIDGKEQTATDVLNNYLKKQTDSQKIYNQRQIREKEAESNNEYSKQVNKLTGILYEGDKEDWVKETGDNWDKTKKAIDDLAIAIAKGEVETDKESLIDWFQGTEFNMMDYEDFDYSVFKQYGDYLLNQQEAINGLTDATIAAQIAMTDFSNNSHDAVEATSNFDTDILRESYDQIQAKNLETTYGTISKYVEEMGYYTKQIPTLGDNIVKYYSDKERTQEVTFTDQDVKDYFAGKQTEKDFEGVLQGLANHFDKANDNQREMFNEIFTDGVQELSFNTLRQFGKYENEQFSLSDNQEVRDNLAKSMGFADFSSLADTLKLGADGLAQQLNQVFTEGGAEFIKTRKNLVKNMTKYSTGAQKDYDVNATLLNLLEAKYKDLDVTGILTDVIGQLEITGDEEFSTAAYEAFRDIMMKAEGEAQMKEALHFLESIDLSNPIDALDKINEEIQSGSGHAKELAIAMKQSGGTFLSLSSQLASLTEMADFEDLEEDLEEIIAKNGEIAALDVYNLADSYKSLDKILKNNEVSAAGLAKALEGIADGTLQIEDLTETVLAALSSFESLESIATKTIKALEEFDLGIDENAIGETVGDWANLIKENLEKGAVGNSQNFRILDYLFPGWDEGLEGDALVAEMTRLAKKLEGNGQNLRTAWSDLAEGKDYKGDEAVFDGIGMTDKEKAKFNNLSVNDTGDEILFSGWEGKGLTSADLVTWISDAYNVSSEMAAMMLTDFKNYSSDLAVELKENDYAAGIEKAYESLRRFGDLKLVDEQEIETIAKLLGVDKETVRTDFESRGATVTQFYDDEGNIKDYQDIKQIMDVDLAGAGTEAGQKWSDSFLSAVAVGNSQGGGLVSALDMNQLEKELKSLGITGLNADKIKQQAFEAVRDGLGEGAQVGYGKVQEVLANGDTVEVTITPDMSWEEYQQQLTKLTQQNENNALAEAIGASVSEAMSAMEITPTIDENTLIEFRSQIESIASEANPQVNVTVSEESETAITTVIDEVTGQPKTIPADIVVNSSDVNGYLYRRIIYVDLKVDNSDLPPGSRGTTDGEFATGIQNSPRTYKNALTGEEGPELIERADGTAYLTGTAGPEITEVGRGDTVYTAEETKDIFKRQKGLTMPRYGDGTSSGYGSGSAYHGSSGGKKGGSGDDKDVWENPFDKLYNLVRKIDEELHQRERIERRYEKLLESINTSANKIIAVSREELAQLERERMLQEQLISGRKYQINQYQSENSDLTKYANVVQNDRGEDVLRINWDLIDSVTNTDEGQRIEDYVSQLEEWFDELEEAEDALWDIEDAVEEIKERGKEEYFNLEDAIKEAFTQTYQDEIDKLSQINDSINNTNSSLLDAIQKSIDKQRQDRDNQRTEDDLAEKQRRLLYLQQDTSGANAMEILKLQEEIAQSQEDYTDTLIDQKISELQEQNDEAAKQRDQQITIAQAQLDHYIKTGRIWQEVYGLMDDGLDKDNGLVRGSRLEEILKSAEGYEGMSEIAKMEWMNDTNNMIAQALAYLEIGRQLEDIGAQSGSQIEFTTSNGRVLTGTINDDGSVTASDGQTYNNVFQGYDGKYYAGENIADVEEPVVEEATNNQSGSFGSSGSSSSKKNNPYGVASEQGNYTARNGTMWSGGVKAIQWALNDMGYNAGTIDGGYGQATSQAVSRFQRAEGIQADGDYGSQTREKMRLRGYKTGGLADFTGPAWLDGTKARPELVLNQRDTQNFIQLKDILASLMTSGSHTSTENNGDITYDIDINVESIGSDYDVEQVANKVKNLINSDARYRNNNTVSLMR